MTWIKLDDKAPRHPKIASLTDRAFRWWVKGLCYASEFLTNGVLHPIFWKEVPKQSRAELTGNNLWDWHDPNFVIHDYLSHQTSKQTVEQKRADTAERVARYRENKRNAVTGNAPSVTSNGTVTLPEDREQIQKTEDREQTQTTKRVGGLILSPVQFARLQETHAFIGSVLRVPNVLHLELRSKSGADAEAKLQAWYERLNEELELSGKGTGDVFVWLRPRHQAYAVEQGWIDPAPKADAPKPKYRGVAEILAEREAAKGRAS